MNNRSLILFVSLAAALAFSAAAPASAQNIPGALNDIQQGVSQANATANNINAEVTNSKHGLAAIADGVASIQAQLHVPPSSVPFELSSGPFHLPANAKAVDWQVVNDSDTLQTVSVSVYELHIDGSPKVLLGPGTVTVSLVPGAATHNANNVAFDGVFQPGSAYEVVVETSSPDVLPAVDVWDNAGGEVIPGTNIPAGSWVRLR